MISSRAKAMGIIALVFGAGIALHVVSDHRRQVLADQEAQAARAVTVLPPGVEDEWGAYVDAQIATSIFRRAGTVEIFGPTMAVSVNTPYAVSCDPLSGASIKFGFGDDVATVEIIGPAMRASSFQMAGTRFIDSASRPVPRLPVDVQSIA